VKAVVTGISGQDGFLLARLLCEYDIEVLGLTSNVARATAEYSKPDAPNVVLKAFDFERIGAIGSIVEEYQPDLIFNLAAKATGRGMFDQPFEMNRINGAFILDILEAIRTTSRPGKITFCQASSSEMFGQVTQCPQTEDTAFAPRSPYGAAKLYAHNLINIYRATYGIRCCSAILYNHESVRRSTEFVTKKLANGVAAIKLGLVDSLSLGYLGTARDWGYAPEYVQAMFMMATAPMAADYIIATGRLTTLEKLVEVAFGHVGLDYKDCLLANVDQGRIAESINLCGDPRKIDRELGWRARRTIEDIIVEMVDFELNRLQT
jgi:GDPmannose 4,6-dehydratase